MHILQNVVFTEYWYVFLVLISMCVSILFYVNNKKKAFHKSLLLFLLFLLFSITFYQIKEPKLDDRLLLNGLNGIEEDQFGTSPDYLGQAIEQIFDFVKRRFF